MRGCQRSRYLPFRDLGVVKDQKPDLHRQTRMVNLWQVDSLIHDLAELNIHTRLGNVATAILGGSHTLAPNQTYINEES